MTPEFHFKGSRNYLHSTTLFDWITTHISRNPTHIDFKFNRKTAKQCLVLPAKAASEGTVVGTWRDTLNDLKIVEGVESIVERRPYDEDRIGAACNLHAGGIEIPADIDGTTFIERLVAGYKALLLKMENSPDARFAFVRLRLENVPTTDIGVRFNRKLGAEFYQGIIENDSGKLGEIYFGRWQ